MSAHVKDASFRRLLGAKRANWDKVLDCLSTDIFSGSSTALALRDDMRLVEESGGSTHDGGINVSEMDVDADAPLDLMLLVLSRTSDPAPLAIVRRLIEMDTRAAARSDRDEEDEDDDDDDDDDDDYEGTFFDPLAATAAPPPSRNGWTALHSACRFGASPEVIAALVDAYPSALTTAGDFGETPLHVACRHGRLNAPAAEQLFGADLGAGRGRAQVGEGAGAGAGAGRGGTRREEITRRFAVEAARKEDGEGCLPLHYARSEPMARLLLRAYARAVRRRNECGRIPLHEAASNVDAEPGVVLALLEEEERFEWKCGAFAEDGALRTPLDCTLGAVARWMMITTTTKRRSRERTMGGMGAERRDGEDLTDIGEMECNDKCNDDEYDDTDEHDDDADQLQRRRERWMWEKMSILVPRTFFSRSPEARQSPLLHLLVQIDCPLAVIRFALVTHPEQATERDETGSTPLLIVASNRRAKRDLIELLLQPGLGCPNAAAIADADGCLPLHLAAESRREYSEGVEVIMKANPRVLEIRDAKRQMFPFQIAAIGPTCNLDIVFALLREKPDLLL